MMNAVTTNDEKLSPYPLKKKVLGRDSLTSLDSFERNSNNAGGTNGSESGEARALPAPCKSAEFLLSGTRDDDGFYSHIKTFCKSYACPFCGPRKVFQIQKGIELAMREFKLKVFASLTLNPRTAPTGAAESRKYIRKVWNKFRILQKRHFGWAIQFVAVVEFQKNGAAHLHILFDQFIPHAWLKETWESVGGGSVVDVREANLGAARYLSKYLGKQMRSPEQKGGRAYSTSQGINLNALLKAERLESSVEFKFCKVSESEARQIFGKYIHSDIVNRRNYILGFKASRQLNPPVSDPTLRNVSTSKGGAR